LGVVGARAGSRQRAEHATGQAPRDDAQRGGINLPSEQLGGGVDHDQQGFAAAEARSFAVGEQAELEEAGFGGADGDGDPRGWAGAG
jgi:hypothetical protein